MNSENKTYECNLFWLECTCLSPVKQDAWRDGKTMRALASSTAFLRRKIWSSFKPLAYHRQSSALFRTCLKHFPSLIRRIADVWWKDVWDFQVFSQTFFELRFSLGDEGKEGDNLTSQTWPGSPRCPSPRHPPLPDNFCAPRPPPPNQQDEGFPLEFLLEGPQTELRTLSQNCEQTLQKLRTN